MNAEKKQLGLAKNTRRLKIDSQLRRLSSKAKQVPSVKLSGIWLEQAGFEIGGHIEIDVKDGQLIITTLK